MYTVYCSYLMCLVVLRTNCALIWYVAEYVEMKLVVAETCNPTQIYSQGRFLSVHEGVTIAVSKLNTHVQGLRIHLFVPDFTCCFPPQRWSWIMTFMTSDWSDLLGEIDWKTLKYSFWVPQIMPKRGWEWNKKTQLWCNKWCMYI